MSQFDQNLQGLQSKNQGIQILSLIQIDQSSAEHLRSESHFMHFLQELNSLCASPNPDIRFLSDKLRHKFEVILNEAESPLNAYSGFSEEQIYQKLEREENPTVLATLLSRLERPSKPVYWNYLKKFLEHPDRRVRSNTIEVFDRFFDPEFLELIQGKLFDPVNRVRANSIITLGKRNLELVDESLVQMLCDPSMAMRESALFCLQKLPVCKSYLPFLQTLIREPWLPIVLRVIDLGRKYTELNESLIDLFFESKIKAIQQKIGSLWQETSVPESVKKRLGQKKLNTLFQQIGVELFKDLKSEEPFDPRLRAHYFLILRQQDTLKILIDESLEEWNKQDLQQNIRESFVALGRTAYALHENEDYFFEQCEAARKQIDLFLKSLNK